MPALDFSDQAVAEEAPDFSAMAEELPDFSDQAVAAEEPPADPRAEKRAQLLREQKDAQLGGRLADVGVGAARLAEGAAEVVRQTNPLTLLPRLAFEVDKKLGFVPESQPNPMDKPVFSPAEVRSALDFFSSETVKPGTATEGAKQFASEFLSGLSSPELIAAAGAGAAPSAFRALVGAAFATDMASHAPEAYKEYIHALEEGDAAEVTRSALNFVTTAAIPVAIASHGLKAEKLPDEIHPMREAELRQSAADTALEATLPLSTKAVKATGRGTEPVPPGITTDLGGPIELPKGETYARPQQESVQIPSREPSRPPAQVAGEIPGEVQPTPAAREVPAAEPGARPEERVSTVEPKEELVRDVAPTAEEPWQMPQDVFTDKNPSSQARQDADFYAAAVESSMKNQRNQKQGNWDSFETMAKKLQLPDGRTYWDVIEAGKAEPSAAEIHKASVEKAIREGKPVPKTVREDYPDLAPASAEWNGRPLQYWKSIAAPQKLGKGQFRTDLAKTFGVADTPRAVAGALKRKIAELESKEPAELARTSKPAADPWERARKGDETAWADLDRQFRETYPEPEPGELAAPSGGRARVLTAEAFEKLFNEAYRDRNFDKILDAVKASDLSVYKPLIQKFFKAQATDATAAAKAEWMRAVFNGTRPPDAKPPPAPRPAPPPRPTPGPTPGGGAPPPSPGPAAQRIPVDPIPGGGAKSPFAILEDFSRNLGKTIRVRRQKPGTLGTYSPASTLTTERFAGDLDTAAHELAGHWVDDKYGIAKPWFMSRQRSPYDTELAKFWVHGSVTPSMSLRYKRAEGIAEFARAYVMNPAEAMRQAPTFGQYFERTLPPEALKAVRAFSDEVRRWAGEDPIRRSGLNIRMDPPTLTEKLWRGLRGRGFGFQVSPIDWLREKFDDPYHYAVKGFGEAAKVRGKNTPLTLKPEENFELNARLLATHDSRMMDQFEFGLVPLKPQQVQGAKGLEVVRLKDPVTGEAMNLEWLNGPFDKATAKSIQADQLNTASYMIAQRTLEKFQQTGKERGISGLGAGIMSDVKAARELLAKVDADPALKAKLEEGARRYRLWANQNIDMLIESGRLGRVAAEDIRKRNEFYVDMHRLSEEFDFTYKQRQSSKLGSPHQPIQRFKGSSLEVNNVYSNLMGQTDSIQKEAHRNMVMRDYTDMLTQAREMHQGPATDLDMFGSRARTGDRNTIPVYRNGKTELWKFDEQIYSSLKGLGDLSTNEIWRKITILPRIARYMITHGPGFAIRNPIRDTMGRTVVSRHDAKPWDILKGYTQAELSRYEVFGGGQFGNYIRDRTTWNKVMKEKMREMSDERTSIFLAPAKLWQGWDKIVQASEKAGRIAEFRRAFDHAKKEFGYDDYNAALYAAGEARGLMDFAKMGTWMREINQAVPFSNAGIRGLARDFTAVKERPVRFALRWTTAVLLPTLAVLTWNRSDPETWKEYQQLPAYLRDMFWNFKVGSRWLRIPKPHLLGVLAGGVERAILRAQGDERAGEGFGGSLAAGALPVSDLAELLGPAKLPVEIGFNRDIFRDREIVPSFEHQLKPELRKGEKHASGAGLGMANLLRSIGLTTDARQVDHVLNSYGGLGQIVTSATDPKRSWADFALQTTGLFVQAPTTAARDYQWVMDWARKNGQLNSSDVRALIDTKNAMFEAKTPERKQELGKKLREEASKLRNSKERR